MDALGRIGIDGSSVLLYAVNFGVLFVVLTKLVYKPLLRFLDERRETIRRSLEEAKELQERFKQEVEEKELQQATLLDEMKKQVHEAKAQAETHSKAIMEAAEQERERILQEARQEVGRLQASVIQEAEKEIVERIELAVLAVLREKALSKDAKKEIEHAWREASLALQK